MDLVKEIVIINHRILTLLDTRETARDKTKVTISTMQQANRRTKMTVDKMDTSGDREKAKTI